MGAASRSAIVAAVLALVACRPVETPVGHSTARPPGPDDQSATSQVDPDVEAVHRLGRIAGDRAERELAALTAPRAGFRPSTPKLLAAVGPCIRPSPAEAKKLEKQLARWFEGHRRGLDDREPASAELGAIAWGCVEPAGTLARVEYEHGNGCHSDDALVRVGGKRVEVIEVTRGSGNGSNCGSEGSYHDTQAVLLVDVDGDGSLEPLVSRRRHEQTSLGDEWVFVAARTVEPRYAVPWREVGKGELVPLRAGSGGETLVHLPHIATYESYDGPHDGVFLEVRRDGVVTDESPAARALAVEARRLGSIIAAGAELQQATLESLRAPVGRSTARAALRVVGVEARDIDAALGTEDQLEAVARIDDFASKVADEIERAIDGTTRLPFCEKESIAFDAPSQIMAWGACPLPSAEARRKVEPALRDWLRAKSGPLVDHWLPGFDEKTSPLQREVVVVRYGCSSADGFFVFVDGGDPDEISVLFGWDGRALTQLSAVAGRTCDDGCEHGPDRRLDVRLGDVDGDGATDAVVLTNEGCDASPTKKEMDSCTKSTVHLGRRKGLNPPVGPAFAREDENVGGLCRVDGTVHLLAMGDDGAPADVLATVGADGFAPRTEGAPYFRRRAELEARLPATKLVHDPTKANRDAVRAALRLLGVSEPDVATFFAERPSE